MTQQQPDTPTADKAAALGMTPTEYRQHSHDTAVRQIRETARALLTETALRVMDALEPPAAPPPTADNSLRTRIADTLADASGRWHASGFTRNSPTYQNYLRQADAVLALLADAPAAPEEPTP